MAEPFSQSEPQKSIPPRRTRKNTKARRDKGRVYATERDLEALAWIAEQHVARFEQIQRLLSRWPGKPMKGEVLSPATTQDQIDRWVRAGWAVSYRFLADQASWVCITRRGLALVELDDSLHAYIPSPKRLDHLWAVSEVRLMLEDRKDLSEMGYEWNSERYLWADEKDAEREAKKHKRKYAYKPIPDGSFERSNEHWIAIEVELTAKKTHELADKLQRLCAYQDWGEDGLYTVYDQIWYLVPDDKIQAHVERQRATLSEADQKRVQVIIPEINLWFDGRQRGKKKRL